MARPTTLEIAKCIKVVRPMEGERLSSVVVFYDTFLSCDYSTEMWTEAPLGGLLAFRDEVSQRFIKALVRNKLEYQIWEALGDDVVELPPYSQYKAARKAWERTLDSGHGWCEGTVAYKHIKLVKRIE